MAVSENLQRQSSDGAWSCADALSVKSLDKAERSSCGQQETEMLAPMPLLLATAGQPAGTRDLAPISMGIQIGHWQGAPLNNAL